MRDPGSHDVKLSRGSLNASHLLTGTSVGSRSSKPCRKLAAMVSDAGMQKE